MDQATLQSFITIVKEGSFSSAADKLHVTQPAISKRIANLEQSLNTQLFDRIGKETRLTHSGQLFLQYATQLLEAMDDCSTAIRNLDNKVIGDLKLGVSHHIGLHRLPPYLKRFSQEHPGVQLKISFVDSETAYQLVQSGELELALATLSPTSSKHISQQCVWRDPLTFVVSDNHPLAKQNEQGSLPLSELSQHPAILPSKETYTGQIIYDAFAQQDSHISHHIETNYLETVRMMVSIGLGWAVLPRTMLNKTLKGLHIKNTHLKRELGYIHHNAKTLSNATKAFLKTISD